MAQKLTILQIFNEARNALGLNNITELDSDKQSTTMINLFNNLIQELADFGNWKELEATATCTAVTSVNQYTVNTSAYVHHIRDIRFSDRIAPMTAIDIVDYRRLVRLGGTGQPRQYSIVGVNSDDNPIFGVYPVPGSSQDGETFNVLYYVNPPIYTSADKNTIPDFPSRVLVSGLTAKAILDQESGAPSPHYQIYYELYLKQRQEALNRFTSDTGNKVQFTPPMP